MKTLSNRHPGPLRFTCGQGPGGEILMDVIGEDGFRVQVQMTAEEATALADVLSDAANPEFFPTHHGAGCLQ